jgi:exopolysaccharide biosynthesis polyprenyl glycosylphosphotransferase
MEARTPSAPARDVAKRQTLGQRLVRVPNTLASSQPIVDVDSSPATTLRERRHRRILAAADALAVVVSLLVAFGPPGSHAFGWMSLLGVPVAIVASNLFGLYDRDELVLHKTTLDEAPKILQLITWYVMGTWLVDEFLLGHPLTKHQGATLWFALLLITVLGRRLARVIAGHVTPSERCLVVGDQYAYARLNEKLATRRHVDLVGRLSPRHADDLHRAVGDNDVHRVIIVPSEERPQDTLDLIRAAKGVGVRVSIFPHMLEVVGTSVAFDELPGMTLFGVRRFGLRRSALLMKRTFDLVGAGLGVLVVSPVLAVFAIAIRLDSRGPVFFRQTRVGRDGEHFEIIKFRTMVVDAEQRKHALRALNEADGLFKIAEDPRVTRVGRVLRSTSLDELPQLFNVLRGEMSLVGPRPLVLDEDAQITGWDRRRLHLTPGMTGHWQIAGSARVPLAEMVKIDYLYVASWSLWGDLKILLRTVPFMLGRRGL